jgi:hypothetical protein
MCQDTQLWRIEAKTDKLSGKEGIASKGRQEIAQCQESPRLPPSNTEEGDTRPAIAP